MKNQSFIDFEENTKQIQSKSLQNDDLIMIPVVFHLLHTGEPIGQGKNISMQRINNAIDMLNKDFRRHNSDANQTPSVFQGVAADTKIEFVLACIDPNGISTTGVIRRNTGEASYSVPNQFPDKADEVSAGIKYLPTGSPSWPTDKYLNVWAANLSGGLLGYAQFPYYFNQYPETDGVVVDYDLVGKSGVQYGNRVFSHEVGHWLNLRHIWGDAQCGDDFVADTPTQFTHSGGACPSHPRNSCGSADMFMNYMDYTDSRCMNIFTQGQKSRMRALFAPQGARNSFNTDNPFGFTLTGPNLVCTSNSTFNLSNVLAEASVSWTRSSNLTQVAANNSSITVKAANSNSSGNGWVRASITSDCGSYDVQENFLVGRVNVNSVSFSNGVGEEGYFCSSHNGNFYSIFPKQTGVTHQVRLKQYPNLNIVYQSPLASGDQGNFNYTPSPGWYLFEVRRTNACGTSNWFGFEVEFVDCSIGGGGGSEDLEFFVYPNPSSERLYVQKKETTLTKSSINNNYELFDFSSNLIFRGTFINGEAMINVSNLKKGRYILKIFGTKKDEEETHHIMVN